VLFKVGVPSPPALEVAKAVSMTPKSSACRGEKEAVARSVAPSDATKVLTKIVFIERMSRCK
jgi:hypothetical protein